MSTPVLQVQELRFRWPSQAEETLNIPSLHIQQGERVFIQGRSGSGKTTLLNMITGINCPQQGRVQVLGTELTQLSAIQRDQFRVDHLGIIFQQFNLLPYLSLLENVQLPCWFSPKRKAKAGQITQTARRLLAELQIPTKYLNRPIHALSVGQQQRVAVARALIGQPEIIIADEPTSALDTDNRQRFLELLFQEAQQQGTTLIFVSHDPQIAQHFPRVIALSDLNLAPTQDETTNL
jgi:putative ABC transport system ATP-binding protein